jgi:signal transduction histidine kinase/CheY-like chemotaxis protein
LWTSDLVNEPDVVLTDEFRRSVASAGHHAVVAVPLKVKGEIIGAMSTAHSERRTFSPAEIDLLQAFADQGALAIRNVQLFAREQAARTDAEAANRAKDQFLALLAHELRNPLAPILTSAVIIRRNTAALAIEHAASIVERQARHLGRLLDDLLDVSRITRGTIELRCETVALAAAVTDALETARPLIDEAGHVVSLSLPPSPVYVHADPTRLEQIVVNILNNAAKYTPAKGRITVSMVQEGGEAVLRIRDTGVGISSEMLPRIFDLFAQGDQSLAHTSGGLGIGLTLVQRLVELHGGRVSVHSDGAGRGSEFKVRLPLSGAAGPAAPETVGTPDRCPACVVLIIEDHADARESLRSLLEREGHRVAATADGPSGLARAETSRPDVVLVDIGLPVMDGYEVARRIRARDAKVILVAISGYGQADDRQRALEAGFDAHLTKPVDPDHLLTTLARLRGRTDTR